MRRVILQRAAICSGPLILVNSTHPLSQNHTVELVPPTPADPGLLLERQAAGALTACVRSVGGEGGIVPVSGWRSREEQQCIWDSAIVEKGVSFTHKFVAYPGCSEHQTGLAIDLGRAASQIDFLCPDFPDEGVCAAFRRAAPRYGFIERYQRGKEPLTGIAPEPWHFRYVGVPHAQLMVQYGLCLEEYSQFLSQGSRTVTLGSGKTAKVFYIPCPGDQISAELPARCELSGDNQGGFIVTDWEGVS